MRNGYVTLRVSRKLTKDELGHVAKINDPAQRKLETDRHTLLFIIAVRADTEKAAIKSLKKMLASELVIEKENGLHNKEVSSTKSKGRRV
jgi:hypothetical protein